MKTLHKLYFENSKNLDNIKNDSIALVITSPPYPMIEMWDNLFSSTNKLIEEALKNKNDVIAFNLMHEELNKVWREITKKIIPGGIVCINIGDATRSIEKSFKLYPNHSKITSSMINLGFTCLPTIIWHKPTNAPNKFMGSGMLPPNAYVTLEHEYILIFRKGNKREFSSNDFKDLRKQSAYFWEERNIWFSDQWKIKGVEQEFGISSERNRTAAFPFELAYRLINMYSIKEDYILDPFLGTGTTILASIASRRNSFGFEIDENLKNILFDRILGSTAKINSFIENRLEDHRKFIHKRLKENKDIKYTNININSPVITSQEQNINIERIQNIKNKNANEFCVNYSNL